MVPKVGSVVAGYRIDALIGRGGTGVVYRATHLRLGRTDALKLVASELAADREFQRRFEREARMAGALDHPNVVPVYDAGMADGVLYLAMRLVEGPDLATVIEAAKGGLDPGRTCAILRQVAAALDTAHARGLVHRDVKPANILIDHAADTDQAERVFLSDFGLTQRFSDTITTMVVGSPAYMAPERFRGVPVAPPIDVYALGCVAYACLTGAPPFNGDSLESVMAGHLYEYPPRVSDRRADLPARVDLVLAKAVAKEPADRYPSCNAFVAALHNEIHSGTADDHTLPPSAFTRSTFWERIRLRPRVRHLSDDRHQRDPATSRASSYFPDGHYVDRGSAAGSAGDRTTSWQLPPPSKPPPGPPNGSSDDEFEPPHTLCLKLRADFRFVGGSLPRDGPIPFLGNQPTVDMLRHRIQHSSGGALLVTGFTGVGKTTVVDRALAELRAALIQTVSDPAPLVIVRLNIARPITPDELMVKLIRNLCEALQEADAFERLARPSQSALGLAYQRTSQMLKEMRSEASERTNELRVGAGVAAGLRGLQVPTLKLGRMRTRGVQQEEAYLRYTLADAEHDFSRIVKELGRRSPRPASRSGWIARRRRSGRRAPWTGRLVIVIDELDKLTAEPAGWTVPDLVDSRLGRR